MESKRQFNQGKNHWIYVDSSESTTISELQQKYQLSDEMVGYALDRNERARVEYDLEHQALLVVYNVPLKEKQNNHYATRPMTFIIKEDCLFTFTTKETAHLVPLIENLLHQNSNQSQYSLLFHILFELAGQFFPLIENVNRDRDKLNEKLRQHTTNQHLLALSDLSVGLVYLVTATKQNAVLLETLKAFDSYRQLTNIEKEQLDDAIIEAKQANEMAALAAQVLEQLSNTYNNLLNNNLNDTMKLLTVWSLLLTIPTIVTGFFGMNMDLPLTDSVFGWILVVVISLGLSVWLLMILWRRIR
ncbi:Mg2+ and Co2+ transporter CorA [Enterococcus sp. PF1-24]|uniref:magnesium transporter CorA family protein n=1 Tax=unclassified Enterococcus TaxID=2608891 RepID=UPI0024759915|nr:MULTISPECIES: magnesium transporter CorA family protein [unclassified Enterococcus]MDH6363944.1 Mg2+ and Co2+ transporter CorA [Enterococcus sp. PFB1-1]MDH6401045.1 Mg2+ and Co2+ transporter CorA [Enterococcus sp. PF1-24]